MTSIERDAGLIRKLGGPTKVAEALGFDTPGSVQRVQNWLTRGIPANIKVSHPRLFMPELAQAHTSIDQPATQTVATEGA